MKLIIEPSVTVLTPTIGQKSLTRAMESVANQTYQNLTHLIVIDGPEYWEQTHKHIAVDTKKSNVTVTTLPYNTGANGMYGHRIFAAFPHLVNTDYIAFLDEDNWWDENHISSLMSKIQEENLDWSHSLRKVYVNDEYLADDCCEAIGRWPIVWMPEQNLVDTSTYCFKREWLINYCQIWNFGWGGDRRFFMMIKDHGKYNTTGLHTLNYNLPDMNKAYGGQLDIFEKHNEIMKQTHGGKYPWQEI